MGLGRIISLLLLLACAIPARAQILPGALYPVDGNRATRVADCGNQGNSIASLACTINGVAAGDLIEACAAAGSVNTTMSVSDGTSSFTSGTLATGSTIWIQCFWLLSANSGNRTYTVTLHSGSLGVAMWAIEFHAPSGTWHIDTGNQATGNSSSLSTGNITTHTSTGEAILFISLLSNFVATVSNPLIGPVTPTELASSPQNTYQHAYWLANDKIIAGSGTLTYNTTTDWGGAMVACYAQ